MRAALVAIVAAGAAGVALAVACSSGPEACAAGDGGWFHVPSTSECCAPLHNQFDCYGDAGPEAGGCLVSGADIFRDDAGMGATFPLGCEVTLTWCSAAFPNGPMQCECDTVPLVDGGRSAPTWVCPN